ncbi:MAG: ankyrin repeat domain-containing protein [Fimbriimonas sp.]
MRSLPARPSLDQLRTQAKDLVKATRATNPGYRLSQAQRDLAREYGFPSWPRLVTQVGLLNHRPGLHAAIRAGDLDEVRRLVEAMPESVGSVEGGENDVPIEVAARYGHLEIVRYLRGKGDPDLQHAFSRAAMWGHEPILRYLIAEGADPNGPYARDAWDYGPPMNAVFEVQNADAMRLLLSMGARLEWTTSDGRRRTPLEMLLATYGRNPESKHACLRVCEEHGYPLPDTPAMALHAGKLDRLGEFLHADPSLLARPFSLEEMYPPSLGIGPGEGATSAPLEGATLLHMAVDWCDVTAVRWLLARGADPNARAIPDADGFNDHPPLFHAVLTFGPRTDQLARILVGAGADPGMRASLRRSLPDFEVEELAMRNATAAEVGAADIPDYIRNWAAVRYLESL